MKSEILYHTKIFRTDTWNVIRWRVQLSNKHVIIFARNELIHHWLDSEDVSIVWKVSLSNETQPFGSWLHFKFRKINFKCIRLHTMKRFLGIAIKYEDQEQLGLGWRTMSASSIIISYCHTYNFMLSNM